MTIEDYVPAAVVRSIGDPYVQSSPMPESVEPHNSDDNVYGFDTGGIVSYVVPEKDPKLKIVDAVAVVPEDQIIEEKTKNKRLLLFGGVCLLVTIVLVVITVVVLTLRGKGTDDTNTGNTFVPDRNPSKEPTPPPTSACETIIGSLEYNFFLGDLAIRYGIDLLPLDTDTFYDTCTTEYRAAAWAVESGSAIGIIDDTDRMYQRYALAFFYFATNGDEWVRCGRDSKQCELSQEWLNEEDECNWYAIECDGDGDIIEIFFPPNGETSNNIRGTLPDELSFLTKLEVFIIARGPMSGPFPNWSKLSTLKQVLLNENNLEGSFPTYLLSKNPLLGTIQFNFNNFQGPFLQDLSPVDPSGITGISVNGNNFDGRVSSQIGKLSSLKHLDIGSNGFTGTLPEELYALTNLVILNVSNTSVSGELSTNIGGLSKLFDLYAGNTNMGGTLPTQLFSLNQLRKLDLGFASFTGPLSESFSNLVNLDFAKLDHNGFTGTIPPGFENLDFLENLELQSNDLSGAVPQELCNRRGDGFMEIQVLTVDCREVSCACCTNCP